MTTTIKTTNDAVNASVNATMTTTVSGGLARTVAGGGAWTGSVLGRLRALCPKRRLSFAEALRVSELQANVLREMLGVNDAGFDTTLIAELPKIRVSLEQGLEVSGMTTWAAGMWLIVINGSDAWARQRFSIAHEFKHIIDHTLRAWMLGTEPGTNTDTDADTAGALRAERLADYFAGCLLMPKRHVARVWGETNGNLQHLASAFDVSLAAISVRVDQLGLRTPPKRCQNGTAQIVQRDRVGGSPGAGWVSGPHFRAPKPFGVSLTSNNNFGVVSASQTLVVAPGSEAWS